MKASELSQDNVSILLIGDPGSGKSHFIGTMPKPLLVFNFDGKAGASTYRAAKDSEGIQLKMFDVSDKEAVLDFEECINVLLSEDKPTCKSCIRDCTVDKDIAWNSAALDCLSTYGAAEMKRTVFSLSAQGKGGARLGGIVPTQTDYGLQMVRVRYMLEKLLLLPCAVVVAAHEMLVEDKNGGVIGVVARTTGKKTDAKNLPAMFGQAFHTEQQYDEGKKETVWRVRSRGSEFFTWCFSKGTKGLPDTFPPNWEELEKCLL